MTWRRKYHGEAPMWASPFLYHDWPFDGTERDAVKIDLFIYLPGTRIIVENEDLLLVREDDGKLGFVDLTREHIFKLRSPTYATALQHLGKAPGSIGAYRNYINETVGFWLNPGATVVAMFDENTMPLRSILPSTQWFATPTRLRQRQDSSHRWETILTCAPVSQPTASKQ